MFHSRHPVEVSVFFSEGKQQVEFVAHSARLTKRGRLEGSSTFQLLVYHQDIRPGSSRQPPNAS
jgi:hypothetical protein